jgi:hypothetical protein
MEGGRIDMRLKTMVFAAALLAALMTAAVASATVHLKGGANAEPSFTDNANLTLTASGALSGLGNGNVAVTLSANANVTATCTNPAGATQPPGQNPAPITVTGSQFIPASSIDKNGNVPFSVTTVAPTSPIAGAPGCPNPKWTETITDLSYTSAVIQVFQPANADGTGGTLVLTVTCTFDPATSNGPVPSSSVTCTSTNP